MKIRLFFYFSIISILAMSCTEVKKSYTITDFNNEFNDVIYPSKNSSYTTFAIDIQGEVNDSIMFKFGKGDGYLPFYLNGEVNEKISFDYYGGTPKYIFFKPFKATKGKIKLTYGIY